MSTMTKVFVVLNAVLSIVVSVLFVAAAAQWANWRQLAGDYQQLQNAEFVKRMNQEAIMATALAMKDDAIKQISGDLSKSDEARRQLADQLTGTQNDLARRSNEAVAAEAGRKKLEEILAVQTAELTATQKQNQTLLTQNIDLQTRNQRGNSRILELTAALTVATDQQRNLQERLYATEQQLQQMQQRAASGTRVASTTEPPAGAVPAKPPVAGAIRGEVLKVGGVYATINIGETSGVVKGMTFMVYRGNTYLGDLEIESVTPKDSGGRLTLVVQDIRAGDRVEYGTETAGR